MDEGAIDELLRRAAHGARMQTSEAA